MDQTTLTPEFTKAGLAIGGTSYAIAGFSYSEVAAILTAIFVIMQIFVFLPKFLNRCKEVWNMIFKKGKDE